MMYIQWSMVSCMYLVRRDHDVYTVVYGLMYETGEKRPWCCIDRVVYCLMYTMVSSHQFHTWDHRPLCIYIMVFSHQFHTWDQGPLYLYTTTWSLHANSMVSYMELVRRDHDVELTEWSMVSCIKLVWRNHDVYTVVHGLMYVLKHRKDHYLSIQHHGLFTQIPYMRQ
jgi:hypothetical protein